MIFTPAFRLLELEDLYLAWNWIGKNIFFVGACSGTKN